MTPARAAAPHRAPPCSTCPAAWKGTHGRCPKSPGKSPPRHYATQLGCPPIGARATTEGFSVEITTQDHGVGDWGLSLLGQLICRASRSTSDQGRACSEALVDSGGPL